MFLTEIDPAILAVFGGLVMGVVQGIKPFIQERYTVMVVGTMSILVGTLYSLSTLEMNSTLTTIILQSIIYSYLIASSAAGSYSLAKAVKKEENLAGL